MNALYVCNAPVVCVAELSMPIDCMHGLIEELALDYMESSDMKSHLLCDRYETRILLSEKYRKR